MRPSFKVCWVISRCRRGRVAVGVVEFVIAVTQLEDRNIGAGPRAQGADHALKPENLCRHRGRAQHHLLEHPPFLCYRRQFRSQPQSGVAVRSDDPVAARRRTQDRLYDPSRHSLPPHPELYREGHRLLVGLLASQAHPERSPRGAGPLGLQRFVDSAAAVRRARQPSCANSGKDALARMRRDDRLRVKVL